jgi:hypothetical protein
LELFSIAVALLFRIIKWLDFKIFQRRVSGDIRWKQAGSGVVSVHPLDIPRLADFFAA